MCDELDFGKTMTGKTLTSIENSDEEIVFTTSEGERLKLYHSQVCGESVTVEDICGNLEDLIGEPLVLAEEATSDTHPRDIKPESIGYQDCYTWTFYRLRTKKGFVTIRWYGESNGYYSESVNFCKVT